MRRDEFDSEQPHSGTDPQSPFGAEFAKLMKQFSSPLYLQTAKILEQISPLDSQTAKILEQFSSPLAPQTAKILEQFSSPLAPQTAKILEQFSSPLAPQTAKILEQFSSPLAPQTAKILEQFSSPLAPQTAKILEQFSSPLAPQTAKILEQFSSPLAPQTAKILKQFSSQLMDAQLEKMIQQYRTPLERSHLGKLLENSFFKTGSVLANLSIEALLKELESRSTELEALDSDEKRPAEHIEAEGHASISVISAGEARVEKSTTTENDVLSSLPTWLIRVVLYVIFSSIQLIAQWEDIRTSIVDLNARLPQTESPSKLRSFIRKELAGKPGDIRLVTGSNVNLRFEASSKSEIILKLPKNSIVVVQGKEDRTWALASYEIDGYWIDGYISTKYLKKVRRN